MGKILNHVRFSVNLDLGVAEWASEQWTDGMVNNSKRINQKRRRKIPDQARYEEKIAEASAAKWKNFVSPDFVSKHGLKKSNIVSKHAKQISRGYDKWQKHLDDAFAEVDGVEAKEFKDGVKNGVNRYIRKSRVAIGLTGDKVRGYGAAAAAAFWLTGNDKALGDVFPRDGSLHGIDVIQPGLGGALKAALVGMLVRGGSMIEHGDYNQPILDDENDKINRLVAGLQDSAKFAKFEPGGSSHIDWVMDDVSLCLDIQVSSA